MSRTFTVAAGAMALSIASLAALAQEPSRPSLFREGECSGVLCSTIGGAQAPQNQPRKSLFPEGQCGGILCSAIGGSQAPRHAEAPPNCGGGLLCDVAPYAMGQGFAPPGASAQRGDTVAEAPPPPSPKPISGHRKVKAKKRTGATD